MNKFIHLIYNNDKETINSYVMYVNCAQGKGIKFIRDDLKLFAKTHISTKGGNFFKSIILLNADKLTIDAQSALRRCIEVFSHTTRFFIVVEDKYKLLKPILSRFCEIYVPQPTLHEVSCNLHKYRVSKTEGFLERKKQKTSSVKRIINKLHGNISILSIHECANRLFQKGHNSLEVVEYFENKNPFSIDIYRKNSILFHFNQIRHKIGTRY